MNLLSELLTTKQFHLHQCHSLFIQMKEKEQLCIFNRHKSEIDEFAFNAFDSSDTPESPILLLVLKNSYAIENKNDSRFQNSQVQFCEG